MQHIAFAAIVCWFHNECCSLIAWIELLATCVNCCINYFNDMSANNQACELHTKLCDAFTNNVNGDNDNVNCFVSTNVFSQLSSTHCAYAAFETGAMASNVLCNNNLKICITINSYELWPQCFRPIVKF